MNVGSMRRWAVALLLSCTGAAPASASQADLQLDNGLRVLARERPDQALVSVRIFYAAGAAFEPDSLAGLAHLSEHLLCDGDPWRRLTLACVERNASTSPVKLTFLDVCVPSLLPRVLAAEAARMRTPTVDEAVFAREQAVVLQELAMRSHAVTMTPAAEAFRIAFPGHPYGQPVGGDAASVARIGVQDVRAYISRVIKARGTTIQVQGPIDPVEVVELVGRLFADVAPGPEPEPLPPYPPAAAAQSFFDDPDHAGYRAAVAVRVPVRSPADLALLDLGLAWFDHEGVSADADGIPGEAVATFSWWGSYQRREADWGYRHVDLDPDRDASAALGWHWRRIDSAVRALGEARRREEIETWFTEVRERSRVIEAFGWLPATRDSTGGGVPTAEDYERHLAAVTPAALQAWLASSFVPDRAAVAVSHGHDSGRDALRRLASRTARDDGIAAADALAGLAPDSIAAVLPYYAENGIPGWSTYTLANGMPVVSCRVPGAAQCALVGWRRFDPVYVERPGLLPGLCRLYTQVACFEARARDGRAIRWPFDAVFTASPDGWYRYAASAPAGRSRALVHALYRRSGEKDLSVTAWASALEFAAGDFTRMTGTPEARAGAWRLAAVLGDEHPAVAAWRPDVHTVGKVKYKDLAKLHAQVAGDPERGIVLAHGGADPDTLRAALEETFGRRGSWRPWSAGPAPEGPARPVGFIAGTTGAGDVNLTLTFPAALPDPAWTEPGLMLLWLECLADRVLDSHLRQQGGWTYHASCSLRVIAGWAVPEITVTCQPGQAPAVLAGIRSALAGLASGPVDPGLAAQARLALTVRLVRSADDADDLHA
ncbi:MAG TPA: insulinase family protein, partial [Candidatus Krumholzibacteria bacterium]|nr:insulinase family protein [Candidatus Krumholzibacteria bacterium]